MTNEDLAAVIIFRATQHYIKSIGNGPYTELMETEYPMRDAAEGLEGHIQQELKCIATLGVKRYQELYFRDNSETRAGGNNKSIG